MVQYLKKWICHIWEKSHLKSCISLSLRQNTVLVHWCARAGASQLARVNCAHPFLASSVFSEATLVACNWTWWEWLHFRNGQILQIRAFVSVFESQFSSHHCWSEKIHKKWTRRYYESFSFNNFRGGTESFL